MAKIAPVLAQNIRLLREKRGWSQEALARKIGVHRNSVAALESGKKVITLKMAARISAAFGIDESDLFQTALSTEILTVDHPIEECLRRVNEAITGVRQTPEYGAIQFLTSDAGRAFLKTDAGRKFVKSLLEVAEPRKQKG